MAVTENVERLLMFETIEKSVDCPSPVEEETANKQNDTSPKADSDSPELPLPELS